MWQDDEFDAERMRIVFGENVGKVRMKNGLSLVALAKAANYDRTCLARLEAGKQNIEFATSIKLAKVLNVSYPILFSRNFMEQNAKTNESFIGKFQEDDYLLVYVENFKRYMRKLNKLQMQVYFDTGVSESMISRIVRGVDKNPTLKTLNAMAFTVHGDMYNLFLRISEVENL